MSYPADVQRSRYAAKRALGLCVRWGCLHRTSKYALCLQHRVHQAPAKARQERKRRQEQQAA